MTTTPSRLTSTAAPGKSPRAIACSGARSISSGCAMGVGPSPATALGALAGCTVVGSAVRSVADCGEEGTWTAAGLTLGVAAQAAVNWSTSAREHKRPTVAAFVVAAAALGRAGARPRTDLHSSQRLIGNTGSMPLTYQPSTAHATLPSGAAGARREPPVGSLPSPAPL